MKRLVYFMFIIGGLFFMLTAQSKASDAMSDYANDQAFTPFGYAYLRLVQVRNASELQTALTNANPGDFIRLADGIYSGNFRATVSGTREHPITLYGSRQAILAGRSTSSGYGFYLQASYWTVGGITIRNSLKGIMTERANFNTIIGIEVYQIGDEGVHFRTHSSDNILRDSWIHDIGLKTPIFGEAVYVGSAISNWSRYTSGSPDKSDRNQITGNLLGPNVSAEGIDLKEGTTGGLVSDNRFISTKTMVVDSWVDVKGNSYRIINNLGYYDENSGFRRAVDIIVITNGWGINNSLVNNVANISGTAALPTPPIMTLPVEATPQPVQTALATSVVSVPPTSQPIPVTGTPQPTVVVSNPTQLPTATADAVLPTTTVMPTNIPTNLPLATSTPVPTSLPLATMVPAPSTVIGVEARIVIGSSIKVNEGFSVSVRLDRPDRAPGGGVNAVQVECVLNPQARLIGSNVRAGTHFSPNALIVNRNFPTSNWMIFTISQPNGTAPLRDSGTVVKFTVTPLSEGQGSMSCIVDVIAANGVHYRLLTSPTTFIVN